MNIPTRRTRKPRAEVTLPLAEWHATTLAIDGLIDNNDELQRRVDELTLEAAERCGTIARLTNERDRARRWAVHLEQDCADLERVNAELRGQVSLLVGRLTWHHKGTHFDTMCQGCDQQRATDPDEVHGVPA